jgi:hypothetical protein
MDNFVAARAYFCKRRVVTRTGGEVPSRIPRSVRIVPCMC